MPRERMIWEHLEKLSCFLGRRVRYSIGTSKYVVAQAKIDQMTYRILGAVIVLGTNMVLAQDEIRITVPNDFEFV